MLRVFEAGEARLGQRVDVNYLAPAPLRRYRPAFLLRSVGGRGTHAWSRWGAGCTGEYLKMLPGCGMPAKLMSSLCWKKWSLICRQRVGV